VIFQDFPGPGIVKKKIQDFPGGMGTVIYGMCHLMYSMNNTCQLANTTQTY